MAASWEPDVAGETFSRASYGFAPAPAAADDLRLVWFRSRAPQISLCQIRHLADTIVMPYDNRCDAAMPLKKSLTWSAEDAASRQPRL